MRENELYITDVMVDDWVYLKEANVDSPIVMCRLTLQHLQKIYSGELCAYPVLITPKLLKKAGFILNKEESEDYGGKVYQIIIPFSDPDDPGVPENAIETFNVAFDEDDNEPTITYLDILVDFPVQNVHELQHLIKACKINKDIKL